VLTVVAFLTETVLHVTVFVDLVARVSQQATVIVMETYLTFSAYVVEIVMLTLTATVSVMIQRSMVV
jgi:hypothetical protein